MYASIGFSLNWPFGWLCVPWFFIAKVWTPMFIVKHFQVAAHSHNSCVWILQKTIVICKPSPPFGPSLQLLTIFGYRFTSPLIGLELWKFRIVRWKTFSNSNGYDRSKKKRLNDQQHCAFRDIPFMFIAIWWFDNLDFFLLVALVNV